jgi:hypothetical protein
MRDTTVRHEVEVDTAIVEAYAKAAEAIGAVERCTYEVREICTGLIVRRHGHYGEREYFFADETKFTAEEAYRRYEAGTLKVVDYKVLVTANFDKYVEKAAARDEALATYKACTARYEGWKRFYLVPGGHIHNTMHCTTCNKNGATTQFAWLPELSGLTEADAVAAHGAWLCTVCFPTAPVEYTNADALAKAAKKEARCPGAGKDAGDAKYGRAKCPVCETTVQVNQRTWTLRAHDKK